MFGWDDALNGVMQLANKFIPDPLERDKFALEMAQLKAQQESAELTSSTQIATAQADINKVEAASEDSFTSRARPFILWICGVAFAYHFVLQPLLAFIFAAFGHKIDLPFFDMDTLTTVLYGMLGLGGLRSFDKLKASK